MRELCSTVCPQALLFVIIAVASYCSIQQTLSNQWVKWAHGSVGKSVVPGRVSCGTSQVRTPTYPVNHLPCYILSYFDYFLNMKTDKSNKKATIKCILFSYLISWYAEIPDSHVRLFANSFVKWLRLLSIPKKLCLNYPLFFISNAVQLFDFHDYSRVFIAMFLFSPQTLD